MRRARLLAALGVALSVIAGSLFTASTANSAPPPRFRHLEPGGQPRLAERLPVNVVFIGYQPGQVNNSQFRNGLPAKYEPVVRSRLTYGKKEPIGITYTYDYNLKVADKLYQERFFAQLKRLAKPAPLTKFQSDYNAQERNVRTVSNNHHIDAPSVELERRRCRPRRRRRARLSDPGRLGVRGRRRS